MHNRHQLFAYCMLMWACPVVRVDRSAGIADIRNSGLIRHSHGYNTVSCSYGTVDSGQLRWGRVRES